MSTLFLHNLNIIYKEGITMKNESVNNHEKNRPVSTSTKNARKRSQRGERLVQIYLPAKLVKRLDKIVGDLFTNRTAFVRDCLLKFLRENDMEKNNLNNQ